MVIGKFLRVYSKSLQNYAAYQDRTDGLQLARTFRL
jgi:hypothetical protein